MSELPVDDFDINVLCDDVDNFLWYVFFDDDFDADFAREPFELVPFDSIYSADVPC